MATVAYIAIALTASLLLVPFFAATYNLLGHTQLNYAGKNVPQSMGSVVLPVYALAGGWALLTGILPSGMLLRASVIVFGLGFTGLIDDMWGDSQARGFGGHFRRLLQFGEITTGVTKAVAGFLFSIWAAAGLPGSFLFLFWRAAFIALTANFFNLLDLRPGRALKIFFLFSLLYAWLIGSEQGILLLFPVWVAALTYFPWDLRSWGMLGDAGANVLGGLLGLVIVLTVPFQFQAAFILALVLFHLLAERMSLTEIIAENSLLNYFDLLGRKKWE